MALSNRMPLLVASLAALMVAPVALAQHHDMLGMMDADGNGAVSAAEHAAAAQAMFDKADANHDGSLDAGEMAGAHEGRLRHGGQARPGWRRDVRPCGPRRPREPCRDALTRAGAQWSAPTSRRQPCPVTKRIRRPSRG